MLSTTDSEIRAAFHIKKLSKHHLDENSLVIDELGVMHGFKRIDIAVISSNLHGYEIKSSKDNLLRFKDQLAIYLGSLQKITVISAPNHVKEILSLAPECVGVVIAEKGVRGAIHFKTIRTTKTNPYVETINVAHLLWKGETLKLLESLEVPTQEAKGNRLNLYQALVKRISLNELVQIIKITFKARRAWRSVSQLSSNDD